MLLVDIGNSRVKCGVLERGEITPSAPLPWRGTDPGDLWTRALAGVERTERVAVANVAGSEIAAGLSAWLRTHWSVRPHFVAVSREAAGVVTRYERPGQLGVDRWLAVIAGYHLAGGAACVIDGGTALTIDVVDGAGQHIGGSIAPGLGLMTQSLSSGTAQLYLDKVKLMSGFGTNTENAISLGCQEAVAGAIRQTAARLAALREDAPKWFVTGGEADIIQRLSPVPLEAVPDLVLRGIAIVSESSQ